MYEALVRKKNAEEEREMLGYLPFYPQSETFDTYKKSYPELLISCKTPKSSIKMRIPLKDLVFISEANATSIGKTD